MGKVISELKVISKILEYPVVIGDGIFDSLIDDEHFVKSDKCALFINKTVYRIYKELITNVFSGYKKCDIFIVEDGEKSKQYKKAEKFLAQLLNKGYTRNSLVIAIGGGVTGDFAGFVASVYMRGIKVIQVPTTLLAMVDSSIGGKVAVNLTSGKNIVGAFYPPVKVLTDISFLKTLSDHELKNGISESMKHAFIGEKNLYEMLKEGSIEKYKDSSFLGKAVELAANFKVNVVNQDETEKGLRAILNFGHTVGHAIESYMKYKSISHGEAVAVGMEIVAKISFKMGYLSNEEYTSIINMISKFDLIPNKFKLKPDHIIDHMKYDKKNKDDKILFVLLKKIYEPAINCQVDDKLLKDILSEYK